MKLIDFFRVTMAVTIVSTIASVIPVSLITVKAILSAVEFTTMPPVVFTAMPAVVFTAIAAVTCYFHERIENIIRKKF